MLYCPKCRTEYRDGFTTCADCQVPLIAELPPLPQPEPLPEPLDFGEPILLLTANTELEAVMFVALLADSGIPAYKQYDGASGVLGNIYGTALRGARVYVPQTMLKQAQDLAEAFSAVASGEDISEDIYDLDEYTDEQ